ncbi:MAG: hypothetical protein GH143_09610, partial [Calditrichaeota bacterium]|nr:hypothetical protein [Calditrichota bacterium]
MGILHIRKLECPSIKYKVYTPDLFTGELEKGRSSQFICVKLHLNEREVMKVHRGLLPFLLLAAVTFTLAGDALSTRILDNGLRVIVVENHTVPLATIEVALRNGSFTETPEKNGLTNLHAHMFFKANRTFPTREACLERARELGIVSGILSREEWENFYLTLPADSLKSGLDFMRESIQYPIFSGEALAHEK